MRGRQATCYDRSPPESHAAILPSAGACFPMSEQNDLTRTSSSASIPVPGTPAKPATEVLAQNLCAMPVVHHFRGRSPRAHRRAGARGPRPGRHRSPGRRPALPRDGPALGGAAQEPAQRRRRLPERLQARAALPRQHPRRAPPLRRRGQLADGRPAARRGAAAPPRSLASRPRSSSRRPPSSRSACRATRTPRPPARQCLELQAHRGRRCSPSSRRIYAARNDHASLVEVYRLLAAALEHARACAPTTSPPRACCSRSASSSTRPPPRASARPSRWTARTRCCWPP